MVQLELAFDTTTQRYMMTDTCEILKAVNSFFTTMLCKLFASLQQGHSPLSHAVYYLYDYYDYQIAGAKRGW